MSPVDWPDEQARAMPFNNVLVSEAGVATGAGYTAPGLSAFHVGAYKTTAVTVNGHGTDVSVEVGWQMEGAAAATVAVETKSGGSATPTTLLFINQGHALDHVKLTGGANVDYSVVESNQLPLPPKATGGLPWAIVSFGTELMPLGGNIVPYDTTDGGFTQFMTSDATIFSINNLNHELVVPAGGYWQATSSCVCKLAGVAFVGSFTNTIKVSTQDVTGIGLTSSFVGNIDGLGFNYSGNTQWNVSQQNTFDDSLGVGCKFQTVVANAVIANVQLFVATLRVERIGASAAGFIP